MSKRHGTFFSSAQNSKSALTLRENKPTVKLRDGEVVVFLRTGSEQWQCRYRLKELGWIRRTTGTQNLELAIERACDWYDEARYRLRAGLAPEIKRIGDIARETVHELQTEMAAGRGKRIYVDYCSVIERYITPFFKNRYITTVAARDIAEFEAWRNERLGRIPAASTLLTFAAAWQRIQTTAINRGWLSQHTPVPRFAVSGGVKAQSRPAFTAEEIVELRAFMVSWVEGATRGRATEMRVLLRDYVELLILTGIRHGTEAMRIQWRHCEWYVDAQGVRYLRIWVSGKTGERRLIAKHAAVGVLERMTARDGLCTGMTLDEIFAAQIDALMFRFTDDTQPYHFNAAFERLLRAAGLLRDGAGQKRTLYSLRHTYATLELRTGTDIHTLAKQMGTSVLMLERFYSKLNATMAAARLA
jgi:integrase